MSVKASAVPENVASARAWISKWQSAKSGTIRYPSWYPGSVSPEHLDGTLAGDFGFDPLNLGAEPFKLKWYVQAELVHGRWAMLAVAGILFKDLLAGAFMGGPAAAAPWFAPNIEYYAPPTTLSAIAFFLFSWVEINRYMDIINPGSVNQDPVFSGNKVTNPEAGYPGFDPLGYSKNAASFQVQKVKEIKNGRLAMLAFAGFAAQAALFKKGPLECLGQHLADPWNTTVWQNRAGEIPSQFFP